MTGRVKLRRSQWNKRELQPGLGGLLLLILIHAEGTQPVSNSKEQRDVFVFIGFTCKIVLAGRAEVAERPG